jgi:tRNA threonylcarbamoyladenosine biosynthesis protein TsaB
MADQAGKMLVDLYGRDNPGILLCPMLDARRMEVFTAFFSISGKQLTGIKAEIIHETSFPEELNSGPVFFFGNGARKCISSIKHPNVRFLEDIYASARFMSRLAQDCFLEKRFENVAYFEPFYLKDFVATVPKNKIF